MSSPADVGTSIVWDPRDPAHFREALGRFATGVTIVTANGPHGPVGMAVNAFSSVSLDPPLVLFCAARSSETWPEIRRAHHFCVNLLAAEQQDVCAGFARKGIDRFADVDHRPGRGGAPVVGGALAVLECEIVAEHPAGDHVIVVGRVEHMEGSTRDQGPLLFYRGGYGRLTD